MAAHCATQRLRGVAFESSLFLSCKKGSNEALHLSLDVKSFFEVMELRASAALHCSTSKPVSHLGDAVARDNSCALLCDRMLEECVADLQAAFAQAFSDRVRFGKELESPFCLRADPFRPLFDRFAIFDHKMGSSPPTVHDWDPALSLMTRWLSNNNNSAAIKKYANPHWVHLFQIVCSL